MFEYEIGFGWVFRVVIGVLVRNVLFKVLIVYDFTSSFYEICIS